MLFVHACFNAEAVPGNSNASHLEVALTGTACPVQLILQPNTIINFGTCNTGTVTTKDIQVLIWSSVSQKVYTQPKIMYGYYVSTT